MLASNIKNAGATQFMKQRKLKKSFGQNVNKSTSYDTPKHLPTAYQGTHQSGERIHDAVRDSESEQITGLLQLHQERHVYGQTGGVLGVSLEDGRVQSHDCAVVAVIVEPLQPPAQRHAHPSYF